MKGIVGLLAGAALIAAVGAPRAFAQSSGSFEYSNAGGLTACVLNNSDGSITGGMPCGPISSGGTACTTDANCPSGTQTCQGAIACTAGGTQCLASGTIAIPSTAFARTHAFAQAPRLRRASDTPTSLSRPVVGTATCS